MIIRKLRRDTLQQKPYEEWNAFVNLIAMEKYEDLDSVQRVAHLCFSYDSEVQNGGHLQYFENIGTSRLGETIAALVVLGAEGQSRVLETAGHMIFEKPTDRIKTVEDYVAAALDDRFGAFDAAYYNCKPAIVDLLADYLKRYRDHFIEITDE
jgi:hypothetical protein